MVKRLIVPLDQSKLSESVLPLARGLAQQLELPVTLTTVVDAPAAFLRAQAEPREVSPATSTTGAQSSPYMPPPASATDSPVSPAALEKLATSVAEAEKYLKGIGETFTDGVVDTEVLYGDPSERILYFTETREDPAIVMASHGRSGLQRVLLGSITARVVQGAVCPVFVVRGSESMDTDGVRTVDQILIPLDGSQFAEHALAMVHGVFGPGDLKLILMRVVETQRARAAYQHPSTDEYVQSTRTEAEAYLEEKASQLRARGHSVTCDFGEGRVAERINDSAKSFGADLIAMATHGSNADLRRFVLGSVAEQVLHEADRPLLLVRPPEPAESAE